MNVFTEFNVPAPAIGRCTFVEFCRQLGVTCTPGQERIVRVAYDGEEPRGDELWGGVDTIPKLCRRVFCAVCGGRAGKSYIFIGLRMLWGALTRPLPRMAPGELASSLIVAPDMRLGRQTLRFALGAAQKDPDIAALIGREDADGFVLHRPDGKSVRIEVLPAGAGGAAVRARSLVDAAMDEAAFFRDHSYSVNDVEIFRAIEPRLVPGGQVIVASTPWGENGLLYDIHKQNFGHPVRAMAAHAPTLTMQPLMRDSVLASQQNDPENAAREFGAEFMGAGGDRFFDSSLLESCTDPLLLLPLAPEPRDIIVAGADFGFRSDSSALAIGHLREGRLLVGDLVELRPERGKALKPSETISAFAKVMLEHGTSVLMSDAHYRETVIEILGKSGLGFLDAPTTPAEAFVKTRNLLREGKLRLPDHPRLQRQLREVVARPTSGGRLTIMQPRKKSGDPGVSGGHGDLVSALVLMAYQGAGQMVPVPAPKPGTREALQQEVDRARENRRRELSRGGRPWWDKGTASGSR